MTVSPFFFSGGLKLDQRFHPVILDLTPTAFASNTTAHAVDFPASVYAGNLLLLIWTNDGTATVTTPTDFTSLYNVSSSAMSRAYVKIAAGTEGGTTINVQTSSTEAGSAHMYHIGNWSGSLTDVVSQTASGGTGTTRAAPALTPTFGAVEALWIVAAQRSAAETVSTLPPNFGNKTDTIGTAGTTGGQTTTGEAFMTVASLTPGDFTLSGTTTGSWTTATIAVRGKR